VPRSIVAARIIRSASSRPEPPLEQMLAGGPVAASDYEGPAALARGRQSGVSDTHCRSAGRGRARLAATPALYHSALAAGVVYPTCPNHRYERTGTMTVVCDCVVDVLTSACA